MESARDKHTREIVEAEDLALMLKVTYAGDVVYPNVFSSGIKLLS